MRGNLGELDICSILRLLESERQTGILYIESEVFSARQSLDHTAMPLTSLQSDFDIRDTADHNNSCSSGKIPKNWFIWLINGKIAYATDHRDCELIRIHDYLIPNRKKNATDCS